MAGRAIGSQDTKKATHLGALLRILFPTSGFGLPREDDGGRRSAGGMKSCCVFACAGGVCNLLSAAATAREVPAAVVKGGAGFSLRLSAVGEEDGRGGSYVGKGLATHGRRLAARVVRGQEAVDDGDWHDDPDSSSGRQRRTARLIGEWPGAGGHAVVEAAPG